MSLSVFLHAFLTYRLYFFKVDSAKMISELLGYSDELFGSGELILWRMSARFLILDKEVTGVLWQNERTQQKGTGIC